MCIITFVSKVATMGALCSFVCMVLVLVSLFTPEWTVSKADTAPIAEKEAAIPNGEKGCKAASGAANTYRSNVSLADQSVVIWCNTSHWRQPPATGGIIYLQSSI